MHNLTLLLQAFTSIIIFRSLEMDSVALRDKLTMAERLELWRASKLKEMKKNKKDKDSPTSQQRRNTFALSLLPSPGIENSGLCSGKENPSNILVGKRDRKAMKWKDQSDGMTSPEGRRMHLSLASPSPCQETTRRKWTTSSPPSPISTGSNRRPMAERSPSMCNILNNSNGDGSGYVTAEEELEEDLDISSGTKFYPSRLPMSAETPKSSGKKPNSAGSSTPKQSSNAGNIGSGMKSKHQVVALQQSLEVANARSESLETELEAAKEQVRSLQVEAANLKEELAGYQEREQQWQTRCELANQDVESMMFLSSVTEQRVQELEFQSSKSRLDQNEYNCKKNKKYKEEYERLEKEKAAYEARANGMIMELQGQMMSLQESAMGRIATLEEQVMEEGRRNEELSNQLTKERQAAKRQSMMTSRIEGANAAVPAVSLSRQSISGGGIESRGSRRQSKSSRRQSCVLPPPMLYDVDDDDDEEVDPDAITTELPMRGKCAPAAPLYADSEEDDDDDAAGDTAMAIANAINSCGTIAEEEEEEDEDV
jgi:hypothetical protein